MQRRTRRTVVCVVYLLVGWCGCGRRYHSCAYSTHLAQDERVVYVRVVYLLCAEHTAPRQTLVLYHRVRDPGLVTQLVVTYSNKTQRWLPWILGNSVLMFLL